MIEKTVMDGIIGIMLTGAFCAVGFLLGFVVMWSKFEKETRAMKVALGAVGAGMAAAHAVQSGIIASQSFKPSFQTGGIVTAPDGEQIIKNNELDKMLKEIKITVDGEEIKGVKNDN